MVGSAMFVVVACCFFFFGFGFQLTFVRTVKNYQSSPDSGAGHGMAWISIVLNVIECETQSYP